MYLISTKNNPFGTSPPIPLSPLKVPNILNGEQNPRATIITTQKTRCRQIDISLQAKQLYAEIMQTFFILFFLNFA